MFSRPRMFEPALVAVILVCLVGLFAPQQLPVMAYKVSLVVTAGVAGYGLDRALFPYARPHIVDDAPLQFAVAQARRALIVAAAMLAVGLGL